MRYVQSPQSLVVLTTLCLVSLSAGCALPENNPFEPPLFDRVKTAGPLHESQEPPAVPPGREGRMVGLPPHIIMPPDVIMIDAVSVVPLPPHHIRAFDVLRIDVDPADTYDGQPVQGEYVVEPDGTVNLGFQYGSVRLLGLTTDEAVDAVEQQLLKSLKKADVRAVDLAFTAGAQQISGPHLVRPDGSVDLGTYGEVPIAGKTLKDAKKAIEEHLSASLLDPEVIVDVQNYRTNVYYIVTKQPGVGLSVQSLPLDGSETVFDAIRRLGGISAANDPKDIHIVRPRGDGGCPLVIPVDLRAIALNGDTRTNYQLLPGDRLIIPPDDLAEFGAFIDAFTAPLERILGVVTFFRSTLNQLQNGSNSQNFN